MELNLKKADKKQKFGDGHRRDGKKNQVFTKSHGF